MNQIEQFFAENPDAPCCYVALGYVKADKEKAEAILAGTNGQLEIHEREAGRVFEKDSEALLDEVYKCEEAESAAEAAYSLKATEPNMQTWKAAKLATDNAREVWQKQLKKEKKAEDDAAADEKQKTADGVQLVDHVVTEKDMAANPEMADEGIQVGDTIQVPINVTPAADGTETAGGLL